MQDLNYLRSSVSQLFYIKEGPYTIFKEKSVRKRFAEKELCGQTDQNAILKSLFS